MRLLRTSIVVAAAVLLLLAPSLLAQNKVTKGQTVTLKFPLSALNEKTGGWSGGYLLGDVTATPEGLQINGSREWAEGVWPQLIQADVSKVRRDKSAPTEI